MPISIREDARLAGQVIRYHTWPHIRQQSVGEHSWQVARILMAIAPRDTWDVLLPHAIVHDIGEIATGDVPYPVKANNAELGAMFDALEHDASAVTCRRWMIPPPIDSWEPRLRWIFKMAEFIEMWEWGLEELRRGNEFARLVADRCLDRVISMTMPKECLCSTVAANVAQYVELRREAWT